MNANYLIRRLFGVRTRREIGVEKYALKALKGDFGKIDKADSSACSSRRAAKRT